MLTRRGGLLLGMGLLLGLVGRILGLEDLYILAAAAVLSVAAAAVYVRAVETPLGARRRIHPPRVHLGEPCRVDLELVNGSSRRFPPLTAVEPIGARGATAEFAVPGLDPAESGRAAYRVPTARRGRFVLGPLTLRLEDPFGLARSERAAGPAGAVLVYPRVEAIAGMPPALGHDPHDGARARAARSQGEDFFALRPYEVGDDLRRVHWPSTARSDELMIRQVELPWQHRTTILLDTRRSVHDAVSFELAVSAAASILVGSHRAGAVTRLVTTGGIDSGFGAGPDHREAALATLAAVDPTPAVSLSAVMTARRPHGTGASVAVVSTTALGPAEAVAVARLRQGAGLVVLVLVEKSGSAPSGASWGPGAQARPGTPGAAGPLRVLVISESASLADAWAADPVLGRRPPNRWDRRTTPVGETSR